MEQILCTGESSETREESPDALMMSDFRAGAGEKNDEKLEGRKYTEEIGDFRFGLKEVEKLSAYKGQPEKRPR